MLVNGNCFLIVLTFISTTYMVSFLFVFMFLVLCLTIALDFL